MPQGYRPYDGFAWSFPGWDLCDTALEHMLVRWDLYDIHTALAQHLTMAKEDLDDLLIAHNLDRDLSVRCVKPCQRSCCCSYQVCYYLAGASVNAEKLAALRGKPGRAT